MKLVITTLCALAFAIAIAGVAVADPYPTRSIRLVVPFAAGGTSDIFARIIGQKLGERLGQTVVVDDRPGAGGNLGSDLVAKSAPDGYTLVLGSVGTHAINPSLYARMPYDPVKDFAPITLIANVPTVLVVNPIVPAKSVRELIAYARANPGKLNYASAGAGTTQHLAGELFKMKTGIDMVHIPYKGGAPAVTDLLGGQVQLMFPNIPVVRAYIETGKLRPLGIAASHRSPTMPDVPTIAEAAALDSFDVATWFGILAPAGTPREVVMRLHDVMAQIMDQQETHARLAELGAEPLTSTPEEFGRYIKSEVAAWAAVVKQAGAKIE